MADGTVTDGAVAEVCCAKAAGTHVKKATAATPAILELILETILEADEVRGTDECIKCLPGG